MAATSSVSAAGAAASAAAAGAAASAAASAAAASPLVAVVMGSSSDLDVMRDAVVILEQFGLNHEVRVVSAHRTPDEMIAFGHAAAGRGIKVIIAGAGGAAHLPGMLSSVTTLPVIGVPVALSHLDGLDSLLSIVQMPRGVPVATVAVNGARNAGLLAVRILAIGDDALTKAMEEFQREIAASARAQDAEVADAAAGAATGIVARGDGERGHG
jgi:5-(carboxyamino)imidazole ribonucleotide mutase